MRPRRLRPEIPRDLETIVLKAMEKDPERRYRTAGAMASDLRAFAEGRAIGARPVGRLGRAWRVARRHRALSTLGAVVALLVVAVGVLAVHAAKEAEFRRRVERAGLEPFAPPSLGVASARAEERRRRAGLAQAAALAPASRVIGSEWEMLRQIPVASYGLGAAFVGGKLYAISGFFTPRVAAYDPSRDAWTDVAPLPRALQFFGTAVIGERIYVVGGDYGGSGGTAGLQFYDPVADAWAQKAAMPGGARWDVGVAVLDGRLWVLGGRDSATKELVARVEVYDPATDRWATAASMPVPRALSGGAGAIGGRIYVAGGSRGSGPITTVEAYDPATDAWTSRAPLPMPMDSQAAVVGDRLFMSGGGGGDGAAVYAYDPADDSWTAQPPMLWGRRAHGVAYDPVGRRLYGVCGYMDSWLPSLEVCAPSFATARGAPSASEPPSRDGGGHR